MSMTFETALTTLKVGDVVRNTDVLETYPHYWIQPGARFVVVSVDNDPTDSRQMWLRLVPADESLMSSGDLQEWANCVQLHEDHYDFPGGDEAQIPVVVDNDALPVAERLAAVFTEMLATDIGSDNMARVVRLNADAAPGMCHSHDFCDANMDMLEAFEAVGVPTAIATVADSPEHEAACRLWSDAWEIAAKQYFKVYHRDEEEDEEEDAPVATPEAPAAAPHRCWAEKAGVTLEDWQQVNRALVEAIQRAERAEASLMRLA